MHFTTKLKTLIRQAIVLSFLGLSLRLLLTLIPPDQATLLANGKTQQLRPQTTSTSTFTLLNDENVSNAFLNDSRLAPSIQSLSLVHCHKEPNPIIDAIRLSNNIHNISLTPPGQERNVERQYFNPTLIALPPHSPYPYLLLSRLVTAGLHQESHICMATFCLPPNSTASKALPVDARHYDDSDNDVLGLMGGIRCATTPEKLNIPPTPASRCEGAWSAFPDIPGFHDPRMFWSEKGEPLVIVNSGSKYGCVGLWIVDIRAIFPELNDLLARKGKYTRTSVSSKTADLDIPASVSYPYLTELTKNPRRSRSAVEKNWILFFPRADQAWIQYDLVAHGQVTPHAKQHVETSLNEVELLDVADQVQENSSTTEYSQTIPMTNPIAEETMFGISPSGHRPLAMIDDQSVDHVDRVKRFDTDQTSPVPVLTPARTIAKLVGSGHTTPNLTASDEVPCLTSADVLDKTGRQGHWHQGSNSLRLILCSRHDLACLQNHSEEQLVSDGKVVHFAVLHRKFSNDMDLPMRYERYFMVWEARSPFRMIGISRRPILFAGEKASPWSDLDNAALDDDEPVKRWNNAYFTYTPSIAWAWRRDATIGGAGGSRMSYGTGYIDDVVIIGIGMDDVAQGFVRVEAGELLSCLRLCPDLEDFDQG